MATGIAEPLTADPTTQFAPQHPWDRNFFLLIVASIWAGVVAGFGWDLVHHFQAHVRPFAPIVHVHAVAFVGWLVLLTVQVLLIRSKRFGLHRKLGVWGASLAVIMVPLALATAWVVARNDLGTPLADPAFLNAQISLMLTFGLLVAAAVLLRNNSSAHKRLMLLASLYLSAAGWARIAAFLFPSADHAAFWVNFAILFAGCDAFSLALGGYDLVTRRRLHPAYALGALAIFASQIVGTWAYLSPVGKTFALRILGQ